MHQEIRHYLEDYLRGDDNRNGTGPQLPAEFHSHLGECKECSKELLSVKAQSQLLRSLRASREVEPRSGFYARVLERIEAQPASIWSILLDRKVGFRLAVASAALVALLGTYLVTSEPGGPEFASSPAVVSTDTPRVAQSDLQTEASLQEDGPGQRQQRDAVLVDLASYHQ
jgi:hypothetical protein